MEDIKNQEMEQENSNNEEKTFTQDEVNRIVQERLSRNKSKNDELEEREKKIIQRELKADCREKLKTLDIPDEYSDLFNGSSEDDLNEFINKLSKIKEKSKLNFDNKSNVFKSFTSHLPEGSSDEINGSDPIKNAFNL